MRESVIYQDIENKGEQKGKLSFCMLLLNQRFGELESVRVNGARGSNAGLLRNIVESCSHIRMTR